MKNLAPTILSFIYFILVFAGISNHELWLDEAQHISLAKNSHSFGELIYNARYEGHPLLWNFILYVIVHATENIFYVQLFHILISTSCVFIILKKAPFTLFVRILISFGYYMLYEYSVISRNYSIGLLFILLILSHLSSSKRNYIYLFFLLALLFNTHLFSSILCVAFIFILWKDFIRQKTFVKTICLLIFGLSVFFCFSHIIVPPDHFMYNMNTDGPISIARFHKTVNAGVLGFLPLPDFSCSNYWSNNFIINHFPVLAVLISVFLFLLPVLIFRKYKVSFITFYGSGILILAFIYFTPLRVATRHCGYFSILLFVSAWLTKTIKQEPVFTTPFISEFYERAIGRIYFSILLTVQFVSGLLYYYCDIKNDFSCAKKTGAFLNTNFDQKKFVALSHFSSGPSLGLYTDHKIFYIEPNEFGSFCKWNTNPISITDSVFLVRIDSLLKEKKEILLVNNLENKMNDLLSKNKQLHVIDNLSATPLKTFKNSTIKSEWYFIYSLKR